MICFLEENVCIHDLSIQVAHTLNLTGRSTPTDSVHIGISLIHQAALSDPLPWTARHPDHSTCADCSAAPFPCRGTVLVAQVLLHPAVVLLLYRVTPDLIPRLPHDSPVTVRHLFRRAVHIRVKIQYPVRALLPPWASVIPSNSRSSSLQRNVITCPASSGTPSPDSAHPTGDNVCAPVRPSRTACAAPVPRQPVLFTAVRVVPRYPAIQMPPDTGTPARYPGETGSVFPALVHRH